MKTWVRTPLTGVFERITRRIRSRRCHYCPVTDPQPPVLSPDALGSAIREVVEFVDAAGWGQPPQLFALVPTALLADTQPDWVDDHDTSELTLIEQAPLPVSPDSGMAELEHVLATTSWPPDVEGCALVQEIIVLPPEAQSDLDEALGPLLTDPDAADHAARSVVGSVGVGEQRAQCLVQIALGLRWQHDDLLDQGAPFDVRWPAGGGQNMLEFGHATVGRHGQRGLFDERELGCVVVVDPVRLGVCQQRGGYEREQLRRLTPAGGIDELHDFTDRASQGVGGEDGRLRIGHRTIVTSTAPYAASDPFEHTCQRGSHPRLHPPVSNAMHAQDGSQLRSVLF